MKHILNDGEGFVLERKNGTEIVDLTNISSGGVSKDYMDRYWNNTQRNNWIAYKSVHD